MVFLGLLQQRVPAGRRVAEAESRFSTSFLTAKGRYCNQDFLKIATASLLQETTLLAALRICAPYGGEMQSRTPSKLKVTFFSPKNGVFVRLSTA